MQKQIHIFGVKIRPIIESQVWKSLTIIEIELKKRA